MALPTKIKPPKKERPVSAEHFVATIAVNLNNEQLDDKAFREFIRNTITIVEY